MRVLWLSLSHMHTLVCRQVASAVQQEPLAPHPSGLVDRIRFMGVGAIDVGLP